MSALGIIGGTGLTSLANLKIVRREVVRTPFGEPSGPLVFGILADREVVFLPRHGVAHTIAPHLINYRANIWALSSLGITKVIAVAAVGGIAPNLAPGMLAVPNQLIDYTWSRVNTFYEDDQVTHVDFTDPYDENIRQLIIQSCHDAGEQVVETGTYAAMQGPRLETAAEINRLERDGCTMVGMTGMPEAALARELAIQYGSCAVVANWAAGRGPSAISMDDIEKTLSEGMNKVRSVLEKIVLRL